MRVQWILALVVGCLVACSYPVRTGYDRNIGGYSPLSTEYSPPSGVNDSSLSHNKDTTAKKTMPRGKKSARTAKSTQNRSFKGNERERAVQSWLGTPYLLGGQTKKGVDCSGFCLNIMQEVKGKSIPRTTKAAWKAGKSVSKRNLQPGDVVFFGNMWGVNHNGIWLGQGKFVHASSSRGVIITELEKDVYWRKRYKGARRY